MDIAGALSIRTNFCQAFDLAGQGRISQNFGFKPEGLGENPGLAATLYTGFKALAIYTPVITLDRLLGTDADNLIRNADRIDAGEITKSAASFNIKHSLVKAGTLGLTSYLMYTGLHYGAFHYLPTDLFKHFVTWGAAAATGLAYLGMRSSNLQDVVQYVLQQNITAYKKTKELNADLTTRNAEVAKALEDLGKARQENQSLTKRMKKVAGEKEIFSREIDLLTPIVDNLAPKVRTKLALFYLTGLSADEGVVPSSSIERLLRSVNLDEHPELKKSMDKKKASEIVADAELQIVCGGDEKAFSLSQQARELDPELDLDSIVVETAEVDEKGERVKINLGGFFRAKIEAAAEHAPEETPSARPESDLKESEPGIQMGGPAHHQTEEPMAE